MKLPPPTRIVVGPVVLASALLLGSIASAVGAPTADEIIAKARAYIGGDAALDAVKSVRFTGSIHMGDGRVGDIEIIVRKPMRQRMTITVENTREITALNGYDAWRRTEPIDNPVAWELTLLDAPQIRVLRANTWEDVGFYKGIESVGGRVEVQGETEIDGVKCVKAAFIHGPGIQFVRCFDAETGRLVLTETGDGETIRESGEIMAGGVRFPKELTTTSKQGKRIIAFTRVQVNEDFPDELFDIPMLMPGTKP
jgi:hypothetical protein